MESHYSSRLGRHYLNSDWLTRLEAAKVLSTNSGRDVNPDYLNVLAARDELHPQFVSAHIKLYQYVELCDKVIRPKSGRRLHEIPTNNALRQRRYKERQRLKKVSCRNDPISLIV